MKQTKLEIERECGIIETLKHLLNKTYTFIQCKYDSIRII